MWSNEYKYINILISRTTCENIRKILMSVKKKKKMDKNARWKVNYIQDVIYLNSSCKV